MKAALLLCSLPFLASAANWPHWRGPNHDGLSAEVNLPSKWSATENILWRLPLPGAGSSTPVIWGERIFLTSAAPGEISLLCLSTAGKELWRQPLGIEKNGGKREGNGASPSPSTDGQRVYALTGAGEFAAFNFEGKEIWRLNVQEKFGKFRYGFGFHSTPLLHQGRLYLQLIHAGGGRVIALEAATGSTLWNIDRPSDGRAECEHSYASACLWNNGQRAYLVTHGNDYAVAHGLKDGKEIWRLGDLNPKESYNTTLRFVASPVAVAGLIVVPTAKNRGVVAVKPEATGELKAGAAGEQWRLPSGTPDVPSPLVYGSEVYLCKENGFLTCLDAKTGAQHYSQRTHNQKHRASPVAADGKIYLTAADGTVSVIKAGPHFELLAANKLPDETTASPAISGGRIYLRGFDAFYAIGAK
jgi:outer membrane protein assembly factor BamB